MTQPSVKTLAGAARCLAMALLLLGLLAACGQKGDLYLPAPSPESVSAA